MSKVLPPLSVVVPALNEADNLPLLVERVAKPLNAEGIDYEILIVDDHSSDNSVAVIEKLAKIYNVRLVLKQGKRGKAYSLLEGFALVRYELVCMIDADLQYPPEAIVPMYRKLLAHDADVVVTNRVEQQTSPLRKLATKVFHFLMARMLFGIDYDTQSGLKLFRKQVLDGMELKPSAWSFDLEFLIRSLEKHCSILSFAIPFGERHSGETKVNLLSGAYSTTIASVKLRFNSSNRKVRRGYRANLELARRPAAMTGLFIAGLLSSTMMMAQVTTGQAQAASLLDPVRSLFGMNEEKKTETPAPATQNTTSTTADNNQSGSGNAGMPAGSTQPVAATNPANPSTPTTTRTVAQANQPAPATATQANPTPANQSETNTDNGTDYYANQSLSADRTSQLISSAKWAGIAGAGIILVALLAWSVRTLRHNHQRKVSRNLYRV